MVNKDFHWTANARAHTHTYAHNRPSSQFRI